MRRICVTAAALLLAAGAAAAPTLADDVKVGLIGTFSGSYASWGPQFQRGAELYMAEHGERIGNARIVLIRRDDGGANPEVAKQIAQELVVRDKVQFLAGVVFSQSALAIAPVATEAKVPLVVFNAATASIPRRSDYIVRTSTTLWQLSPPIADWAIKHGLGEVLVAFSDYAPGHDARDAFKHAFTERGGKIVRELPISLQTTDFAPFVQRIKDDKPRAAFMFMPSGPPSIGFLKAWTALGLREAGITLLGTGETDELDLPAIGDAALDVVSTYYYSPCIDSPRNKAWVAAYHAKFGAAAIPNFASVTAYDGMHLIYEVVRRLGPKFTGEQAMTVMRGLSIDSPRGPLTIDAQERDTIQTVYIRRVQRVDGKLCNATIASYPGQKDLWKVLNK